MNKLYNVGMYIRLSRESTAYIDKDSMSIENQQTMMSKFIVMMPGWIEKRVYIDDGATGGNFNRQGFQDMMADVRQGIINLVLVQDLSRFGRNYLEAGKYLEEELPSLGCRFVALSDGIDTEDGENDIMPFLNAMNDYYLKNLSDRIKIVLTAKAKDGQKLSGAVPYGYDRNPHEHTRLIVDDYAAGVVKRIFELRATGMGYAAIAGVLNKDDILPPRLYYFQRQNRETHTRTDCTTIWRDMTVKSILANELYIGNTVAFKKKVLSYRDSRSVRRDESEWIRTENTHIPLIDEDLWQKVQQINADVKKRFANRRQDKPSLFGGIVVCADCQINMAYEFDLRHYASKTVEHGAYKCRTHTSSGRTICSSHRISERNLKKLVLDHIKEQAKHITIDENGILDTLLKRLVGFHKAERVDTTKARQELERQLKVIEVQIEQLYEDKVLGNISTETFTSLAEKTEVQRKGISDRLAQLTQTAEQAEAKTSDINRWMGLIKEKSTFDEVDRDLLESLIEKIEIGEKQIVDGVKTQDIQIHYKYVGSC